MCFRPLFLPELRRKITLPIYRCWMRRRSKLQPPASHKNDWSPAAEGHERWVVPESDFRAGIKQLSRWERPRKHAKNISRLKIQKQGMIGKGFEKFVEIGEGYSPGAEAILMV